jgi:hypothetical protein
MKIKDFIRQEVKKELIKEEAGFNERAGEKIMRYVDTLNDKIADSVAWKEEVEEAWQSRDIQFFIDYGILKRRDLK